LQGRYNVLFPCTGNSARSIKVGAVSFFETIPLRVSHGLACSHSDRHEDDDRSRVMVSSVLRSSGRIRLHRSVGSGRARSRSHACGMTLCLDQRGRNARAGGIDLRYSLIFR
jgi:hypothetical protein